MNLSRSSALFLLAALSSLVVATPVHGQDSSCIAPAPGDARLTVTPPAHSRNVRPVVIDLDALRALPVNAEFTMSLDRRDLVLRVEHRSGSGGVTCSMSGQVVAGPGVAEGEFVLAVVDDAASGFVRLRPEGRTFQINYGGPGVHYVCEVDRSLAPICDGTESAGPLDAAAMMEAFVQANDPDVSSRLSASGCFESPVIYFDIAIVYTTAVRVGLGSSSAAAARCAEAVEAMTQCLFHSGLPAEARLAHCSEVGYVESGSVNLDLYHLQYGLLGLDYAHQQRDASNADFTVLLTASGGGAAGVAPCTTDANSSFAVVVAGFAASNYTLAHEVGHNIGCSHNPEEPPFCDFPQGRGYYYIPPGLVLADWYTVMSYGTFDGDRIPYYSNPNVTYQGVPTGTAAHNNASVISLRQYACEDFRTTRMDVWADFSHGGLEFGTFSYPYNDLPSAISRLQSATANLPEAPVLHLKSGSAAAPVTISKRMRIEACGGTVVLGTN